MFSTLAHEQNGPWTDKRCLKWLRNFVESFSVFSSLVSEDQNGAKPLKAGFEGSYRRYQVLRVLPTK
jgi:hypothetical protein